MKAIYWGALTAALLAGCSTMSVSMPEGRWQEATPSIGDTPMSFQVKKDRISAYAGCNRMMATMEMDGDRLVIGHMASTLMACYGQDREREEALQNLLGGNPHVKYEGDDTLVLSRDDQEYRFNKLPSLEGGKTRFIYVAAEKVPCTGVAPMECLQIREEKDQPWTLYYDQIEGFEPEPGIAYRLRIKEFDVPNPPADAPNKRWVLDMIIEQEVVNES